MIEVPLWAVEAALITVLAFVMLPLGYWLGYRDRSRRAFIDGYRKGRQTKVSSPFEE